MCSLTCMVLRFQYATLRSSNSVGLHEGDEDDKEEAPEWHGCEARAATVAPVSLNSLVVQILAWTL
jgi:hypothetical protein